MKTSSMQFKFLITIISAILAVAVFVGGLSLYEVDKFVETETQNYINVTCEKEVSQINDDFGDMENAVHIMESYVYGLVKNDADVKNPEKQIEMLNLSGDMFADVAKHSDSAVAYYLRFSPEISHGTCGFFYSRAEGKGEFVPLEVTDLLLYDKNDNERVGWYWQAYEAKEPVWLLPYYNKNNGILMISYVVPLFCNNEFFGIVGMDFDYTVLTDRVHNIEIYENGFAHLEFEGSDIFDADHAENSKFHEHPEKYLSVSKELKNGMNLIISASYDDISMTRHEIEREILLAVILLALLFVGIMTVIVRRIVHPLKTLTEAFVKLSEGDYDIKIEHSNTHEIKLLSTAFENMTCNLKEHERVQSLLAYRDSLSGLRNTNSYRVWVSDFDKKLESEKTDFGILMFDLDYLKETNDRYGHEVGDKLIVCAAQFIAGIFKRSPVFRIGGDEFLVVLQNRDFEDVDELLFKFDEACKNEFVYAGGENIPLSISKGFARYDAQKDSKFVDVFNRADDAMYGNKRKVKGVF